MAPPKDRLNSLHAYLSLEDGDYIDNEDVENPHEELRSEAGDIKDMTEKISDTVEEIQKVQCGILSSPRVDLVQQKQLDRLMEEVKINSDVIRTRLRIMGEETELAETETGATALVRMRWTQHMVTSRRFQEVMINYNRVQVNYRERSKAKIQRQLEIAGIAASDEDLEKMLEGGRALLTGHINIEGSTSLLR